MKRILAGACLVFIVAFWGATFPIVKQATSDFSVLGFLAIRFCFASAVLGLLAMRRLTWSTVVTGMTIGAVMAAAYLLQTYGLQDTSSSNTGIITGMFIVFVPLTNRLIFGARTELWFWLGIVISIIGLILLMDPAHERFRAGDLLAVACAAGFGLQVTLLDQWAVRHHAGALAFCQVTVVGLTCAILWPLLEPVRIPDDAEWAAIIMTGLIGSALACFVQTWSQQQLSAVQVALIIMLEPAFAALFSWLLLDERYNPMQWSGAALMMMAIVFVGLAPLRPRRRAIPADPARGNS